MIACCMNVRNEVDVIGINLRHLIAHGIDKFYIFDHGSRDGTTDVIDYIAAAHPDKGTYWPNNELVFNQAARINELVAKAIVDGADWIVPVDADEFMYPTNGGTIAETLNSQPEDVRKLYVQLWQHHDWKRREIEPLPLPKVVFRPESGAALAMGQHEVSIPGGVHGLLSSRHLQYRSFEHFVRKMRDGNKTIAPETLARGDASHISSRANMTDGQLREEWDKMQSVPTIHDPIPVKR